MATQPQTPATPESGIESARAALTAALSGSGGGTTPAAAASAVPTPPTDAPPPAPAPAPAPAPTPAPEAEAPAVTDFSGLPVGLRPTPLQPATSTPPAPPAAAGTPAPNAFTDPAAARFLEMHGGNVEKALAAALAYNNRLAALRQAAPEMFAPGAPADPRQPISPDTSVPFIDPASPQAAGQPPADPNAPPVGEVPPINWEQVVSTVDQQVKVDTVCLPLIQQWTKNSAEITEATKVIEQGTARLDYLGRILSDPVVSESLSEIQREDLDEERRTLSFNLGLAEQKRMIRTLENRDLDQQFRSRRGQLLDSVASAHHQHIAEQTRQQTLNRIADEEANRIVTIWPGAFARVVASHQIPQETVADFEVYARQTAEQPNFIIPDDVEGFLSGVAKKFLDQLDRYHRVRAAQYGQHAVLRAATPSPAPPAGSPAPPPAPTGDRVTPEQAIENASRHLRERLRG